MAKLNDQLTKYGIKTKNWKGNNIFHTFYTCTQTLNALLNENRGDWQV